MVIIEGFGFITNQSWVVIIFFIAIGVTIYSTINAAGFYRQSEDWLMFIILIAFIFISF